MKKAIVIGFIAFVLSLPSMGMAASVGNTADTQGGGKFSLGMEYDRLDKIDMKFEGKGSESFVVGSSISNGPYLEQGDSIKDFKSSADMVFLKGTLGLHPNVDLFLKVGMADANFKYKYVSPGSRDTKIEFDGDSGFAWGVGLKAKLFETSGGLKFMAGAQYLYYEVDGGYKVDGKELAKWFRENYWGTGNAATATADSSTEVQEWHAALYAAQTFGIFSPYAGVKYSDLHIENNTHVDGATTILGTRYNWGYSAQQKAKADKNIGVFFGTDIYVIPNQLSVNIEGRLLDETAGTIGTSYKF